MFYNESKCMSLCTPKVGDFYIFSASHQHCVMPFKTKKLKEVRRSMSFNFIVKENVVK